MYDQTGAMGVLEVGVKIPLHVLVPCYSMYMGSQRAINHLEHLLRMYYTLKHLIWVTIRRPLLGQVREMFMLPYVTPQC